MLVLGLNTEDSGPVPHRPQAPSANPASSTTLDNVAVPTRYRGHRRTPWQHHTIAGPPGTACLNGRHITAPGVSPRDKFVDLSGMTRELSIRTRNR